MCALTEAHHGPMIGAVATLGSHASPKGRAGVREVCRWTAALLVIAGLAGELIQPVASQSTGPIQSADRGAIVGVVINERREPVPRVTVQAFPTSVAAQQPAGQPPYMRASGSAQTDGQGRFRIAGLEPGSYLVGAGPLPASPLTPAAPMYAGTFYPSTIDLQQAAPVIVSARGETQISIELVPARGVKLSGTVVNPSGRPTAGMVVSLFSRFGGYGSGSAAGVVTDTGTFEISNVLPGWHRLSVESANARPNTVRTEFAERLIEVGDRDVENIALVFTSGATITGRVVAEPGSQLTVPEGLLRVSASPRPELSLLGMSFQTAIVGAGGAFRLSVPSGRYAFGVRADREPFVEATRILVDGVEESLPSGVELAEGAHQVILSIGPRALPKTMPVAISQSPLERFTRTPTLDVAIEIVARGDASVLPQLVPYLSHDDRRIRGNAAFVFAGFNDDRGFDTIVAILEDRTYRPRGQGDPALFGDGRFSIATQIREDRYYAAHLLGDIRDPRGVPLLLPLLGDQDVNYIVPWALGEIGGPAAIAALITTLDHDNPSMRVLSIYALETLRATDALPRLASLVNDQAKSNFGNQVSVAAAAKAAIAALKASAR
jgi:hypothetical protein